SPGTSPGTSTASRRTRASRFASNAAGTSWTSSSRSSRTGTRGSRTKAVSSRISPASSGRPPAASQSEQDDLLRHTPRARRRAVRQDGRVLQGQPERDRHRRASGGSRPPRRRGHGRVRGAAGDARPPPGPHPRYGRAPVAITLVPMATTGTETFESTSPADGETIGVFPRSTADDVDRAVASAKEAYAHWRLVPGPKRGEILFRFARLLEQEKDALTDLMTHEMGKVRAEAGGDVQEAIDITYYMAGEGRRLYGQTTPSELPDKWNMSVRMPVGVVGAITPWNFPIAIPSWKLIPALICGNTVVLKPASDTPALAERFVELLGEAGLPDGVVNIVFGGGSSVGDRMVRHPDIRVITLTGSRETGVRVLEAGAETLKHVHLELGGKNAVIVMDDADLDLAVDGIVWSAFGTSGQRCTAASRVIVHEKVYDALQTLLVGAVERMRIGAPWEDETELGPVINETAVEKIHSY